jgi:hypothetical protein
MSLKATKRIDASWLFCGKRGLFTVALLIAFVLIVLLALVLVALILIVLVAFVLLVVLHCAYLLSQGTTEIFLPMREGIYMDFERD